MGLKGGRNILVEGTAYRWKFKAHKDNLTNFGQSAQFAHVAIHTADGPGKLVAQVETKLDIPVDNDLQNGATHKARFSPGDVKKLILVSIDCGWDDTSKTQFSAPEDIDLTDYKTR
ncbi:hypothetical protein N9917_00730 [Deltaproteobacteria bacterium]|nr:hypothetical protein [Deltaproteobacteria bacterium]